MSKKWFTVKSIVVALVLLGCAQAYAAVGVVDVFAALADISTVATDAQSDVAVAANAESTGTDAASIRDAVAAALAEAQGKAEEVLQALESKDQDAAESAYEELADALQKAQDALAGKLVTTTQDNEEVSTGVVTKSDAANTGGESKSSGNTNVRNNLSDPDFLQAFKQRQANIFNAASAFGGDDLSEKQGTPD